MIIETKGGVIKLTLCPIFIFYKKKNVTEFNVFMIPCLPTNKKRYFGTIKKGCNFQGTAVT